MCSNHGANGACDYGSWRDVGVIDFIRRRKRGIKPIIGCEVYVAKQRFDKVHYLDAENRHLVLLCENEIGFHRPIALVSKAWTEGFAASHR